MTEEVIIFNVGGTDFVASKATLQKSPWFEAWLRNSTKSSHLASPMYQGKLFIDRDPEAFRDILAFLRSGRPVAKHADPETIKTEADFYLLDRVDFNFVGSGKRRSLFLPPSTRNQQRIHGTRHDRTRNGDSRYCFESEVQWPEDVPTHQGGGGKPCCVTLAGLTEHGFRKVSCEESRIGNRVMEGDVVFERIKTTHYVDLQEYDVPDDGRTWDVVEKREVDGQTFAVVTKYE